MLMVLCLDGDWRSRAEEARAVAQGMRDEHARQLMYDIAAGYERLAQRRRQGRYGQQSSTGHRADSR